MKKLFFLILLIITTHSYAATMISFNEVTESSESDEIVLLDFIKNAEKPVILKFYADWCAPCRRMTPILNQIEKYFSNRIFIISINVDTYKNLCNYFNIRYLPTFIYFKNGKEAQRTNSINQETMINTIEGLF